jgi:methylthioribose-1-phosphate isomerase
MKFPQRPTCSLLADSARHRVHIVDQTLLPFSVELKVLNVWQEAAEAIRNMRVRGAPLIGVTAAYGIALAMTEDATDTALTHAYDVLLATRPTAVNLSWALRRMYAKLLVLDPAERADAAWREAELIAAEDVAANRAIGEHGLKLFREIHQRTGKPVNVLTHCNAGRMACVDWGTATAPIYLAQMENLPIHVWVEETRPRNQGLITQWELADAGVAHTYIVDNAGGHLMQHGQVDIVIVGVDRVSRRGDVANKIGTYLKALAAHDNQIGFYAAAPLSSVDATLDDGVAEIPIESRESSEVSSIRGLDRNGCLTEVQILSPDTAVLNPGFDVTPAKFVTGILTEKGIYAPSQLAALLSAQSDAQQGPKAGLTPRRRQR